MIKTIRAIGYVMLSLLFVFLLTDIINENGALFALTITLFVGFTIPFSVLFRGSSSTTLIKQNKSSVVDYFSVRKLNVSDVFHLKSVRKGLLISTMLYLVAFFLHKIIN